MKNRLQIRYFMPAKFPFTREQAIEYIQDIFETDKSEKTRLKSLPGEPIAVYYNSSDETDQFKALRASNVLLAIGRGGDGENIVNNEPYFLIDTAKVEEDIAALVGRVDGIDKVVEQFTSDIQKLYKDVAENKTNIANIWKKIGDKSDGITADTIYGFINNRYETIVGGKNIPTKSTLIGLNERLNILGGLYTTMSGRIDTLNDNLNTEVINRELGDNNLTAALQNEADNRIIEDKKLNDKIVDETARATGVETKLTNDISSEVANREAADILVKQYVDAETIRAKEAEHELQDDITTEELRAEAAEKDLGYKIDAEKERAVREENTIKTSLATTETRLESKINEEVNRLTTKDNEITSKIEALQASDTTLTTELVKTTNLIMSESATRSAEDEKLQRSINDNVALINKNRVVSNGKTILVTNPNDNGTNIEVNVDNKTITIDEQTGNLRVSSDALVQYKGEAAVVVSEVNGGSKVISLKVNPNDKVLTNEDTGILVNLSLNWNNGDSIQLIGKGGQIISEVPVDSFIKDGMIDNVYLDQKNPDYPELVFVFNTASGKQEIRVPVKDLLYQYSAGKGLELVNSTFNIKIDSTSEVYLTVSESGLKLSGITNLINTVKNEITTSYLAADNILKTSYEAADAAIYAKYDPALENIDRAYKDADNAVRADFATADANLRSEIVKLFETTNSSLASEISSRTEADANLQKQIDTVVTGLSTEKNDRMKAVEESLIAAKSYSDANKVDVEGKIALEASQREAKDNELSQTINGVEAKLNNNLETLNGDATVNGSVKSVVYNSALAKVVTSINPEDATEQTLLRKVMLDGQPMVYSSNDTQDMTHKGEQLSVVIDRVLKIEEANDKVVALENKVLQLEARLAYYESDAFVQKIKDAIITADVFKGVNTETKVDVVNGSTVTFGFADDAIFKAGN